MAHDDPATGLGRLWALAEKLSSERAERPEDAFGEVGLYLTADLELTDYAATPANGRTFAWTGVDGIHFSLLLVDGAIRDSSPVVMTVPGMFGAENLVVGENLVDFLALGSMNGFDLEGLVEEDRSPAIDAIESGQNPSPLLRTLADAFEVSAWQGVGRRLEELQDRFGALIERKPSA